MLKLLAVLKDGDQDFLLNKDMDNSQDHKDHFHHKDHILHNKDLTRHMDHILLNKVLIHHSKVLIHHSKVLIHHMDNILHNKDLIHHNKDLTHLMDLFHHMAHILLKEDLDRIADILKDLMKIIKVIVLKKEFMKHLEVMAQDLCNQDMVNNNLMVIPNKEDFLHNMEGIKIDLLRNRRMNIL